MDSLLEQYDEVLKWDDKYRVGVPEIDNAHQRLFSIVRRLIKNISSGNYEKDKITCIEAIKYLKQYTIEHFAQEEEFQLRVGYSDYENHKRIHDNMREITIPALEKQMYLTNYSEESVRHFATVCASWLVTHVMTEDQAIVGKAKSQWGISISSDAMGVLRSHAEQYMRKLFLIEVEPENLNYDAYDVGDTLNYYIIYRGRNNVLYRSVVLMDKKLACKIVSRLMGKEVKHLTEITMSMVKELSQKFVEYFISKYTNDVVTLISEGMVEKEAFQTDFKNYHPDISMLWSTDSGCIALCMRTVMPKRQQF